MDDAETELRRLILPCSHVVTRKSGGDLLETRFGGRPYAEADDRWPICGGCGAGLTFVFQWNLAECPHTQECGLGVFFYCFRCSSWGDVPEGLIDAWALRTYDHAHLSRFVPMVDPSTDEHQLRPSGTSIKIIESLPDWESLDQVSPSLRDLFWNRYPHAPFDVYEHMVDRLIGQRPGLLTQIDGYPRWVQGGHFYKCPTCQAPMRMRAQIDSEESVGLIWGDMGRLYLFGCNNHPGEARMTLECC
jgi:hypothetical protein